MTVIRKKTGRGGTEGGTKVTCNVCSADVTSTVHTRCAHPSCTEYDLCIPCFSSGQFSGAHNPGSHPYNIIEQHSIPIYTDDWGADEELLLLEGCMTYGLGSWADIAAHIGGFRDKDEVRDHYYKVYIESSKFPLPELGSPNESGGLDKISREDFQSRKKRRVEAKKEAAKNMPPQPPKQKPTASVPACHEVQGYMPGRMEFETEFCNEAEEAVQHMQFEPGDGISPVTGQLEPEMELKLTVMDIYNSRLTSRVERKKVIFEHGLLEYRKNAAIDKKRTKEERDLLNKAKPFARAMNRADFEKFCDGLITELNLRQAIGQLQEWRNMKIGDLRSGEKYEQEKLTRNNSLKTQSIGQLDRLSSRMKSTPPVETPSATAALVAPKLPLPPFQDDTQPKRMANGETKAMPTRPKFVVQPLHNVTPLVLNNENASDLHLLTPEEQQLCSVLRILPKPYLVIKEHLLKEAQKSGGTLKKKAAREICRIDVNKASRVHDFFVNSGWIAKA